MNSELNDLVIITTVDITKLQVDAIVNAANSSLLGGGGVDGAIHAAAGIELYWECETLNGCPEGHAKITRGYQLPARYVIHTVGPKGENEHQLRKCYLACLDLCLKHRLRSIAFCCISTGRYGYPVKPAAKVALKTVREWLDVHWREMDCVIFCTYSDSDLKLYKSLMPYYFPLDGGEPLSSEIPGVSGVSNTTSDLKDRGLGSVASTRPAQEKASM